MKLIPDFIVHLEEDERSSSSKTKQKIMFIEIYQASLTN